MNVTATSSDRFSLRAWTVSLSIHAVALVCAVGLLRDLPTPDLRPSFRLDFLLVDQSSPPSASSTQHRASVEKPSTTAPAHPTSTPDSSPQPIERRLIAKATVAQQPATRPADDLRQAATEPVTDTRSAPLHTSRPIERRIEHRTPDPVSAADVATLPAPTTADSPQPVERLLQTIATPVQSAAPLQTAAIEQQASVPALATDHAVESTVARVDTQSPLIPHPALQGQTAADTIGDLTGPPSANPSAPPSTLQAPISAQADAGDQSSLQSAQPTAETADSGLSSAQEAPGPVDAPVTTVVMNHPPIGRTLSLHPDYGWLTDSLRRRVESLKAYPRLARMQGWEGIVVVRATIKNDGSLLDAIVTESSGYASLDEDALKLMQRACPIHLPHDLGQPHIEVLIPVHYRLE